MDLTEFKEISAIDFEFYNPPGELPVVHCLVAAELHTGEVLRLWRDQMEDQPPFSCGKETLVVAFAAQAELKCFKVLGWAFPTYVLDLCVEFKNQTSGYTLAEGKGLLGALVYYGISGIDVHEKAEMQALAMRGGPFLDHEQAALMAYCQSDVEALSQRSY